MSVYHTKNRNDKWRSILHHKSEARTWIAISKRLGQDCRNFTVKDWNLHLRLSSFKLSILLSFTQNATGIFHQRLFCNLPVNCWKITLECCYSFSDGYILHEFSINPWLFSILQAFRHWRKKLVTLLLLQSQLFACKFSVVGTTGWSDWIIHYSAAVLSVWWESCDATLCRIKPICHICHGTVVLSR